MQHKTMERMVLFAEVAKQLNFAKAARVLNISKGYLSDQIKTLELELCTPLLLRTTRSVRLTSEGEKVLSSTEEINYILGKLEKSLNHLDGCIRITAPELFTERFLMPAVREFQTQHPDVRFQVDTSYTRYDLNQAQFDMAFRATRQPPENMIAKPLFSYKHALAASPSYLKKYGKPNSPNELKQHSCLTSDEQTSWLFNNGEVNLTGAVATNDNRLLKQMALEDQGIVRLPDYYLSENFNNGELTPVLEDFAIAGFDIYLLYPTTTRETARLRRFLDFIADYPFPS